MWKDIVSSSADGRGMTVKGVEDYVKTLNWNAGWRPSGIVIHNTGAPTLKQWMDYDAAKRIHNLVNYYKNTMRWSAGPHAFFAPDFIWPFTPWNTQGVHSPSFNGTHLGFELVGDYSREDDDRGPGFRAKMNLIATCALVCMRLGLDPAAPGVIRFHKEDPRTTHKDCPGKDVNKEEIISLIQEWMAGGAGELPHINPLDEQPVGYKEWQGRVAPSVKDEGLNLRVSASASSKVIEVLEQGRSLTVCAEAQNGRTKWLNVKAGEREGWVAARYVEKNASTPQQKETNDAKSSTKPVTPASAAVGSGGVQRGSNQGSAPGPVGASYSQQRPEGH